VIDSLIVACPICAVDQGQPCEDVEGGFVVNRPTPHAYRQQVAFEEATSGTTCSRCRIDAVFGR
jgi:hypothetical protein